MLDDLDIDSIKIISEIDETTAKQRMSYNYRVVMVQQHAESDMRGRSSAGQKMIASIVIRLALFTAFCNDCSFIAFDEPTTNLDEQNLQGLAEAFRKLSCHKKLKNFQLILITHDETFLRYLCHDQDVGVYFETSKNKKIAKRKIKRLSSQLF
ncbi:DNA repair protein RAD50 [Thelohanellus kitauei]|uniref:DNA repair protein RAD50 n=1 Tax=Thelohanellus kitauei TaxID=669202 RepID=A0A0C2JBI7_THEKT|nr:DNA repair protein RAD50 [Thelohanellus kitauei]